jgi:hypothetical protein
MAASCRTGPFPGPTLQSFTFNPGDKGSITLSRDPFSDCLPGINPLLDNPLTSPYLTAGLWSWIPNDPLVGYANLTCNLAGQYGSQPVEWSVHGLTCTISDPGPESAGRFTSSAAPLRGGKAVAFVQHFPGTKAGALRGQKPSRGLYRLTLRDGTGQAYGSREITIVSGRGRTVPIPTTGKLRALVAKRGHVNVTATLRRIDGKPGSGDREVITIMKDHPSLPF